MSADIVVCPDGHSSAFSDHELPHQCADDVVGSFRPGRIPFGLTAPATCILIVNIEQGGENGQVDVVASSRLTIAVVPVEREWVQSLINDLSGDGMCGLEFASPSRQSIPLKSHHSKYCRGSDPS